MALDLAGRCDRLAFLFGVERLGQDAKVLDLLDPRKLAVRPLDLGSISRTTAALVARLVKPV